MVPQAFVSGINLTEHSLVTWSASTQQARFVSQNALYPEQPFMPWRTTTALVYQDFACEFGAQHPLDCVQVVNTNYTALQVFLFAESGGSIVFGSDLTAARNPWTGRYTASLIIQPAVNTRIAILRILAAPTTDGATYFSTGGVWWGAYSTRVSRDIRWNEKMHTLEPVLDTPLPWGAIHRRRVGQPSTRIVAQRPALISRTTPGVGDELSTWLTIDRYAEQFGMLAWFANRGNPAEAWIMRRVNEPAWPIAHVVSEDEIVLEELVAP